MRASRGTPQLQAALAYITLRVGYGPGRWPSYALSCHDCGPLKFTDDDMMMMMLIILGFPERSFGLLSEVDGTRQRGSYRGEGDVCKR